MWWKPPTLPVTQKDKEWVEQSFVWFIEQFGMEYARATVMLLPTAQFFPDAYQGTTQCAQMLLARICAYMQVDPATVKLDIYDDHIDDLTKILPLLASPRHGPAGVYFQPRTDDELHLIGIETKQLQDPVVLTATLAHEVGHVILLGDGRIERDPYHELLTDLLTVFCGFGIFSANCARMFKQYQEGAYHGWQYGRHGYLSQQVYGYSLACWSHIHNDLKPSWARYLTINVKADLQTSLKYLRRTGDITLTRLCE